MKAEIEQAVAVAFQDLFVAAPEVLLSRTDEQFGDYTCNVALELGPKLNKNPRDIADALAKKLNDNPAITSVEVAGPGFLNFKLSDDALWKMAKSKPTQSMGGKVVLAEYSDPNPFKVLHAGHLYTTIVGDAVASLLQQAGAEVHRLNYGGDVGLHVGRAMWAIVEFLGGEHPEKLDDVPADQRLEWLSERYVEGTTADETDESAKAEITAVNQRVYSIHADNDRQSAFAQIYWTCRQWSYEGFDKLYKELQVTAFEKYIPESEVVKPGMEIIEKGLQQGVFEKSDGAVVYKGEKDGLHTRVFVNSNGLPTYEAKDLGLAALKWQQYHFDLSIIITANDILEYMKVVVKALSHFYPEVAKRGKHLTHGMIRLPGNQKMSSRKGNILRAVDILDAAESANQAVNGKSTKETSLAAVKYGFLKQRVGGDIVYDPQESVGVQGNSGPYLQYAHARARSILAKAKASDQSVTGELQPGERSLLRKMGEYAEVIDKAVTELMPHHVCTYLYELAQTFNQFYEANHVVGDEREALRLGLVQSYATTLKHGLGLLGIVAPEKM